jgi:hypothetical protein
MYTHTHCDRCGKVQFCEPCSGSTAAGHARQKLGHLLSLLNTIDRWVAVLVSSFPTSVQRFSWIPAAVWFSVVHVVKSVSVVRKSTECERLQTESFRYCEWGKRYENPRSVLGRKYLGSTASVTGIPRMLMKSAYNSSSTYYYMNNERVILNLILNKAATRHCLST